MAVNQAKGRHYDDFYENFDDFYEHFDGFYELSDDNDDDDEDDNEVGYTGSSQAEDKEKSF